MAAFTSQRAAVGGWGSLQEDLLGCIAALLPLRERFGVLPLVCRQFYEGSGRWEIAGLGIFELYTPATPLSTQGITRRCQNLGAWLDKHAGQLACLRVDLPASCTLESVEYNTTRTAVQAAIMPAVEKAAWRHRAAFTSLVLGGANLAASLAAAGGQAPAESGLAACVALRSLEIDNYEGSPTQLAQLLSTLPQLPALRLHYARLDEHPPTLQCLLQGPPAEPVPAALQHLQPSQWVEIPAELLPGLLALTALTYLHLTLPHDVPFIPDGISQLRHLVDLRVLGYWYDQHFQEVPPSLASLPLTCLHFGHCCFPAGTRMQRRLGGLPAALETLAPTLRELQLDRCSHRSVPLVVSTLTRLTCLSMRYSPLDNVPAWLTRLECLERLEVKSLNQCTIHAILGNLPHLHTLSWGGRALEKLQKGRHLGRLTKLVLGGSEIPPSAGNPTAIDLGELQGSSRLEVPSISGDTRGPGDPPKLLGIKVLDELSSLTNLELHDVDNERLPPEGAYLSRLRSLTIKGKADAQLPAGLSSATGLTALSIHNIRIKLDKLEDGVKGLLRRMPLLQELTIWGHSINQKIYYKAQPFLVADLLGQL